MTRIYHAVGVYIIKAKALHIIACRASVYHQHREVLYIITREASASLGGVTELDFAQSAKTQFESPIAVQTKNAPEWVRFLFGAATQIRTGDLILTKDVLYQLSHSSNLSSLRTYDIITNPLAFVKRFFEKKSLLLVFLICLFTNNRFYDIIFSSHKLNNRI